MQHPPTSLALASLGWCARDWAPETTTDDLIRRLSVLDSETLAPLSQLALKEAGLELLEAVADSDDESAEQWLVRIRQVIPKASSLAQLDGILGGTPEEWRSLLDAEDSDERAVVVAARLMVWLRRLAPDSDEPPSLERLLAIGWPAPGCQESSTSFYRAYSLALYDAVRRNAAELEPVLLGARLEPAQWSEWLADEAGLPPIQTESSQRRLFGSATIAAAVAAALAAIWWFAGKSTTPGIPNPAGLRSDTGSVEKTPNGAPSVTLSGTPAPPVPSPSLDPPTPPDPLTKAKQRLAKAKEALQEGNSESADVDALAAQDLLEGLLPVHDVKVGEALKELADHWESRERWSEAARLLQKTVQCYEGTPAENAGPQLDAVNRWAGALRKTGRLTESEKLYRTLLKAYEGTGPALEVDAATVAHNLANALVDGGRFADARGFYERALSLLADHWPTEDEAQRLAGIMGQNYQHCLVALGFPDNEALAQTRRLLKLPSSTKGR